MKKIALFLVLILVLCSTGCGANTTDFKTPDKISDYQYADFDKFNSPAEENGLGGTQIYVDGVFEKIFEVENAIFGRLKSDNNKWCVSLSITSETKLSDLSFLEGKKARIFGVYKGFSENFGMPALSCIKFTFFDTGECYNIAEFFSSISPAFDGILDAYVEGGQKNNPKDVTNENSDNLDNITVNKFINRVETASGISLQCLDKTIVDDVTAYIYTVNDDISIHIKEDNKNNIVTSVDIHFKNEAVQKIYTTVFRTFDTSIATDDEAVDIFHKLFDSIIKDDTSIGFYEKKGFRYYLYLMDDGSISISISKE